MIKFVQYLIVAFILFINVNIFVKIASSKIAFTLGATFEQNSTLYEIQYSIYNSILNNIEMRMSVNDTSFKNSAIAACLYI